MAPEQLDGAEPDAAFDVYALTAVAFEALSDAKRGRSATLSRSLTRWRRSHRLTYARHGRRAREAAAHLLASGMSREPSQRPRSAGELARRLHMALTPARSPVSAAIAARATAAPAPRPPRPAQPPRPSTVSEPMVMHRSRSRARIIGPMSILIAAGAATAVILGSHGPQRSPSATTASHAASAHQRRPGTTATTSRARQRGTYHTTSTVVSTPPPTSAATHLAGTTNRGSPAASSAAATSTNSPPGRGVTTHARAPRAATRHSSGASSPQQRPPSTTLATPPPAVPTASPISAVESFYTLAAAHRYAAAWTLADPAFRAQLAGYDSFQATFADDRSITFDAAHLVSRSSATATVAVRTTSVRARGTQRCVGSVQLVSTASDSWLLHLIAISCQ